MFKKLFSKGRRSHGPLEMPQPHYAVGDIHGRIDLLERLGALIADDKAAHPALATATTVYIGDYIDRGDHSAQVLAQVQKAQTADPDRVICLKGNHEEMMLNFLDNPAQHGRRWLRYGGLQTLASYGVTGVNERSDGDALVAARQALVAAMPAGQDAWLRALPTLHRPVGNVVFVHAALEPDTPVDLQDVAVRLWGAERFMDTPRADGVWVVHGHTIVDEAAQVKGRIQIDTGAYATGRLTAVALSGDTCRFLQT